MESRNSLHLSTHESFLLIARGFLLSIGLNESIEDRNAFVQSSLSPKLEFVEENNGMAKYKVNKRDIDLGELLQKIIQLQKEEVVMSWSVAQSSLDDVFLKVCMHHERL